MRNANKFARIFNRSHRQLLVRIKSEKVPTLIFEGKTHGGHHLELKITLGNDVDVNQALEELTSKDAWELFTNSPGYKL